MMFSIDWIAILCCSLSAIPRIDLSDVAARVQIAAGAAAVERDLAGLPALAEAEAGLDLAERHYNWVWQQVRAAEAVGEWARAAAIAEWRADAGRCYEAWRWLTPARNRGVSFDLRRRAVENLRAALGEENWGARRMPPPMPWWWFRGE